MSRIEYWNFENKNQINDVLNLIYDFLSVNRKTDESEIYKNAILTKINQLSYSDKTKIQEYIFEQSWNKRWDDKLQLLELYSAINNLKNYSESNEYSNLDFDVIWWTINWKYKIVESYIDNIWNWQYIIHIKWIKRQNRLINKVRKYDIKIMYNSRNWVIRYDDWYGRNRIATIDHKYEIKFFKNKIYNNRHIYKSHKHINWTIYKSWVNIPLKLRYKWQKIILIIKF
jgi:hypothetical protein